MTAVNWRQFGGYISTQHIVAFNQLARSDNDALMQLAGNQCVTDVAVGHADRQTDRTPRCILLVHRNWWSLITSIIHIHSLTGRYHFSARWQKNGRPTFIFRTDMPQLAEESRRKFGQLWSSNHRVYESMHWREKRMQLSVFCVFTLQAWPGGLYAGLCHALLEI